MLNKQKVEKTKSSDAPSHIAIIMDGNGRWAGKRGLPRSLGHKKGADAVKEVIEGSVELGVDYLTLYAFSSENWNRPESEVSDLMGLLKIYIRKELNTLHKNNIRIRFIGDRSNLEDDIRLLLNNAEELTRGNSGLTLVVALSYGSRQEMVEMVKKIAQQVASGEIAKEQINEELIDSFLYTKDIPSPDLLIRTSGEKRLSNFLLWQMAYTEFLFLDVLWPDFTKKHLKQAIDEFFKRERRYGL